MTVDTGIDIWAERDDGKRFKIQVKTATKKKNLYAYDVRFAPLKRNKDKNTFYIFVMRDGDKNKFLILSRKDLLYKKRKAVNEVKKHNKYRVNLFEREDTVLMRNKKHPVKVNNWESILARKGRKARKRRLGRGWRQRLMTKTSL